MTHVCLRLVSRGVCRRFTAAKFSIKKVRSRVIGGEPIFVQKKIVNFVGKDKLFDFYVLRAETRDEVDGLREVDVTIIVAMYEENGRFPSIDSANGRRLMRELRKFWRNILAIPIVGRPI